MGLIHSSSTNNYKNLEDFHSETFLVEHTNETETIESGFGKLVLKEMKSFDTPISP